MLPTQLKGGIKQMINKLSPASIQRWREAHYFRRYGEFELRLVKALGDSRRDAIDVGANLGAYLHFMRRSSRIVHAFEPVPWLAVELARKFPTGVVVHDFALSNRNDVATLHLPVINGHPDPGLSSFVAAEVDKAGETIGLRVRRSRLDDEYDGDVGFIKIDVEGHERAVLEGAIGTIDRCRPNLLVEIEERFGETSVEDVARYLHAVNFRGYFVDHGRLRATTEFDPLRMQRAENIAGFGPGLPRRRFASYINNFIFVHADRAGSVLSSIAHIVAKPGRF